MGDGLVLDNIRCLNGTLKQIVLVFFHLVLIFCILGGPYIKKCVPRDNSYRTVTFQQYDVTNDSSHIYSHSGYRFGYKYYR